MRNRPDKFVPIHFDEAGHRVATQYLLSALDGDISFPHLKNYRVGHAGLPGHPELHCTPGVKFSSGRLGQVAVVALCRVLPTLPCVMCLAYAA